jgi:hypothetical protein
MIVVEVIGMGVSVAGKLNAVLFKREVQHQLLDLRGTQAVRCCKLLGRSQLILFERLSIEIAQQQIKSLKFDRIGAARRAVVNGSFFLSHFEIPSVHTEKFIVLGAEAQGDEA